ncbi:FKBP-like peptidyl-prolyl cis-trans isomerase family protein isoform X2 [Carex rostrata]
MASFPILRFLPAVPMHKPSTKKIAPARGASQDDFESIDLRTSSGDVTRRRNILFLLGAASTAAFKHSLDAGSASAAEYADLPALRGKDYGKTKMRYPDYTETQSGLQYKDLRVGTGSPPKIGETVVGGDKDFFKFTLGYGQVIPAFEEAVAGMAPGGVRRIIVPPELGYPDTDFSKLGPRPTTFSGQRALAFVLDNQGLIDKTLLFDIELLKVIPAN